MAGDHYLEIRAAFPGELANMWTPVEHGPGSEQELRGIAERHAGEPLHWFNAYGGNLYAEDGGLKYAIRTLGTGVSGSG